jgi:hypothetical protein
LTLTFPSVSGVGTFLDNDADPGTQYSASLALYDGATLLGTVAETSDATGDPIYLGATDTTGADITSAVYSLTVAGQTNLHVVSYTYNSYDCNAGHVDTPLCTSLPGSLCTVANNDLQCPQKCLCQGFSHAALPITSTHMPEYPNFGATPNLVGTPDTDPSNLADFYFDSVDFAGASSASSVAPEPETIHLLGACGLVLAALLQRKFVRRSKEQSTASQG